jgi:polyisoprenoid-binding protein YceI
VARYRIVPERSRVWIEARSTLHPIHSTTDGLEGYIELEVEDGHVAPSDPPVGKLSLPTDRLSSGNVLEDRELRRRIDIRRYPTIDGRLTKMVRIGKDGRYRMSGDLEFRGVTRECEDEMHVEVVDDHTLRLTGESTFDIGDFGMEPPRLLMLRVEPRVVVRVEIIAEHDDN